MFQMNENQVKEIQNLSHANQTAEALLKTFAMRKRLSHATDINRFKYNVLKLGVKINEPDYIESWKKMQDLGLGELIPAKDENSHPIFTWKCSLKDVGYTAFPKPVRKPGRPKGSRNRKISKRRPGRPKGSVNKSKEVVFKIRGLTPEQLKTLTSILSKAA